MQSLIPALAVKDIPTSLRFYTDVLGFETTFTLPDDTGDIVHASLKRGRSPACSLTMDTMRARRATHFNPCANTAPSIL